MLKSIRNQTIALAGISQAVYLVKQIAKRGTTDTPAMESSISSILKIDAENVDDVYGEIAGVTIGLKQLKRQLMGRATMDPEQAHYAAMLVFLQQKLKANPQLAEQIRLGIDQAAVHAESLPILDEKVLETLAETYQQTISKLRPRIVINGEQVYLTDPENANKIRSLLLAGIRSAALWVQCGGSRINFFFRRGKILAQAQQLLKEIDQSDA